MPPFKFQKQTEKNARFLYNLQEMKGLEGDLSDDGLSYEFKDGEDNYAKFTVNTETGKITGFYDPPTNNAIFHIRSTILSTLPVIDASKGGKRRRKTTKRRRSRTLRRGKYTR